MVMQINNAQTNLSLNSLCYAEACNEFAWPISVSFHSCNTAPFRNCCSGGKLLATLSDLTSPRFESRSSRSRNAIPLDQVAGAFQDFREYAL